MLRNWQIIFLTLTIMVSLVPISAEAQDNPAGDIFAGYSLLRVDPGDGLDHVNVNGWNLAVTGYLNPRFGLTFEGAGYYKSVDVLTSIGPIDVDLDLYTFMVGPQIKLFKKGPVTSSLRIVFGGAKGGGELQNGVDFTTETVFAMSVGTAYDIRLGKRVAWRFSPGFLLTRFADETQHNFRFSTGLVFYLGGS